MNRRIYITITGLAAILVTGCTVNQSGDAKWEDPFFRPPQTQSHVTRIFKTATNNGAARDATIQAIHFDGTELNELGLAKIESMINASTQGGLLNVFLDLPKTDPNIEARQATLNRALTNSGLTSDQFTVALGTNPNNVSDSSMVLSDDKNMPSGGTSSSSASAGTTSGNVAN